MEQNQEHRYEHERLVVELMHIFKMEILHAKHDEDTCRDLLATTFLRATNIVQEIFMHTNENMMQMHRMSMCLLRHLHFIFPCTALVIGDVDATFYTECNLFLTLFLHMLFQCRVHVFEDANRSTPNCNELVRLIQLDDDESRRMQIIAILQKLIDKPIDEQFHWNLEEDNLMNAQCMTYHNWLVERRKFEEMTDAPDF